MDKERFKLLPSIVLLTIIRFRDIIAHLFLTYAGEIATIITPNSSFALQQNMPITKVCSYSFWFPWKSSIKADISQQRFLRGSYAICNWMERSSVSPIWETEVTTIANITIVLRITQLKGEDRARSEDWHSITKLLG